MIGDQMECERSKAKGDRVDMLEGEPCREPVFPVAFLLQPGLEKLSHLEDCIFR